MTIIVDENKLTFVDEKKLTAWFSVLLVIVDEKKRSLLFFIDKIFVDEMRLHPQFSRSFHATFLSVFIENCLVFLKHGLNFAVFHKWVIITSESLL